MNTIVLLLLVMLTLSRSINLRDPKMLAERGNAEAQYRLAGMYAKGEEVPQAYALAAAWYQKAAHQGVAAA